MPGLCAYKKELYLQNTQVYVCEMSGNETRHVTNAPLRGLDYDTSSERNEDIASCSELNAPAVCLQPKLIPISRMVVAIINGTYLKNR